MSCPKGFPPEFAAPRVQTFPYRLRALSERVRPPRRISGRCRTGRLAPGLKRKFRVTIPTHDPEQLAGRSSKAPSVPQAVGDTTAYRRSCNKTPWTRLGLSNPAQTGFAKTSLRFRKGVAEGRFPFQNVGRGSARSTGGQFRGPRAGTTHANKVANQLKWKVHNEVFVKCMGPWPTFRGEYAFPWRSFLPPHVAFGRRNNRFRTPFRTRNSEDSGYLTVRAGRGPTPELSRTTRDACRLSTFLKFGPSIRFFSKRRSSAMP